MKKQTLLLTRSFAHTCHCPPITLFQFLESLEQKPVNVTQRCSCGPRQSGLLGLLLVPRGSHIGGEVSSPLHAYFLKGVGTEKYNHMGYGRNMDIYVYVF